MAVHHISSTILADQLLLHIQIKLQGYYGRSARALIDSCSTESFIHLCLMDTLDLKKCSDPRDIAVVKSLLYTKTLGHCTAAGG